MRNLKNNKHAGALYEQRFILECMEYGLHVFSPVEEGLPQDVLVMNKAGKIFNIQVKGTSVKVIEGKRERYRITAGSGSRSKKAIDCDAVDFLAAHINPDVWYIIPCESLKSVSIWLYHGRSSVGCYEEYLNRWDLLTEESGLTETNSDGFLTHSKTSCNDSWTLTRKKTGVN